MRTRTFITVPTLIGMGCLWTGCGKAPGAADIKDRASLQRFAPLPDAATTQGQASSQEIIALGRMLYFDTRLSRDQSVSCNSCHPLDRYGVDGKATSEGYKGQHGTRNSPSVYNAAAQFVEFWDGRAASVEEQAKGPMLNPAEMAMPSGDAVVRVLKSMPGYIRIFEQAFPTDRNPVTFENAARAIGAFERKLLTPARWDRFLRGDEAALTPGEKAGYNTFVDVGCSTCHAGALIGGSAFQSLGAMKPYPDTSDSGRYNVTKRDSDKMLFKVPALRNVAVTGPYFHNGKVVTLDEAIDQMAEYQLGKTITEKQKDAILVWLKALTGDLPADYIKQPQLPNSTRRTPRPAA